MITLHIIVALTSLVAAAAALVRPSQKLLKTNYILIASTLFSGIALVALGHNLLHMCMVGVVYSAVSITMVALARKRIATQAVHL